VTLLPKVKKHLGKEGMDKEIGAIPVSFYYTQVLGTKDGN
jgi:hypothetical protein